MKTKPGLPLTDLNQELRAGKTRQTKQFGRSRTIAADPSRPEETEQPLDLDSWKEGILVRAGKLCGKAEAPFDHLESAALQALRLRLVAFATERAPDFAQIKTIFGLLLEAKSQQIAARKLKLARKRMGERAKPQVLTREELQARLKRLFGWSERHSQTEEAS
jgi:hypothetical protein